MLVLYMLSCEAPATTTSHELTLKPARRSFRRANPPPPPNVQGGSSRACGPGTNKHIDHNFHFDLSIFETEHIPHKTVDGHLGGLGP